MSRAAKGEVGCLKRASTPGQQNQPRACGAFEHRSRRGMLNRSLDYGVVAFGALATSAAGASLVSMKPVTHQPSFSLVTKTPAGPK